MDVKYRLSTTAQKGGKAAVYSAIAFSLIQRLAVWLCVRFDSTVDLLNTLQDVIVVNETWIAGALMAIAITLYTSGKNWLKNGVFPYLKKKWPWISAAIDSVVKFL